jgi:Raf kinase inhibitor-like YbhB/YbcL family protein
MRALQYLTAAAAVIAMGAGAIVAQDKGGKGGGGKGKGGGGIPAPLTLKLADYADGSAIPAKNGCANGNMAVSPKIDWSGAPAGTVTFALIMHDTDVDIGGDDVLHWAIFNIPGTATGLAEKLPNTAELPDGSRQLNNIGRTAGFFGPCPPAPTVHHYIIEAYALDAKLDTPATASRADLMAAMKGHVRAKGTYVGTYHQ